MQTHFSATQLSDPATATCESVIRKCVHCGFCLATCPTYVLLGNELDSPRGRIYLMKQMLESGSKPTDAVVKHVDRCLSCLSCMTTCPSGVHYMHLVDHARAYIEAHHRRPLMQRVLRSLVAHTLPYPKRFRFALSLARLARPLVSLIEKSDQLKPVSAMLRLAPERTAGPASTSVPVSLPATARKGRVVLLQGCVESTLRPEIRSATLRLLARAGYEVAFAANEGCCGALVHHMGREKESLAAARRNVDAWTRELEAKGVDAIVITASGCGTTIKEYGFMLREDPAYAEKAACISALAKDVCELLDATELPARASLSQLTVAYHSACSMQHGQRITTAPMRLLTQAGFQVRQPAESHLCCGSAGVYNIFQPVIAGQLGDRKVAQLSRLQPDVIATGNVGCAVQIGARSSTPVVHTVELLDWATGGPVPPALTTRPGVPRSNPPAPDKTQGAP